MRSYVRKTIKLGKNTQWVFHMKPDEYFKITGILSLIALPFLLVAWLFFMALRIVLWVVDLIINMVVSLYKWIFNGDYSKAAIIGKVASCIFLIAIIGFLAYVLVHLPKTEGTPKKTEQKAETQVVDTREETGKETVMKDTDIVDFPEVPDSVKPEFLFWDSDRRYLTEAEASSLDPLALQTAINEIYARHGRIWTDENWNSYFISKSWYSPLYTEAEFDTSVFNDYEKKNVSLLASYRK